MMLTSEFREYLIEQFPNTKIYNGVINKNDKKCIGLFPRGSGEVRIALGGLENTSYMELPLSILVHWTENSNTCQMKANEIYMGLHGLSNFFIGDRRIVMIKMLDPCPVDISRDENNICEMVIRINILYER